MAKSKNSKGTNGRGDQYKLKAIRAEEAFDPKASRIRFGDDDVYGGDEDEFHKNRDSVLFEDDGRRGRDADSDLEADEEVYGLDLPDRDDSASEDDYDDEDEDDRSAPAEKERKSKSARVEPLGRYGKTAATEELAQAASDVDSEAEGKAVGSDDDDEEDERWAAGQYHVSRRAPGEADSSDDEALELEAEEARRLQKKMKDSLAGEDYGLVGDDEENGDDGMVVGKGGKRSRARAARLEEEDDTPATATNGTEATSTKTMTETEAIAFLLKNHPETLALLDDFSATAERVQNVERNLVELRKSGDPEQEGREHPALAIMELEHQALVTYLPTLTFYFSLLLAPTPNTALITKVLDRLATLRQALATMEELDLTSEQYEADDVTYGEDGDEEEEEEGMLASELWDAGGGVDDSDSDEDEDEAEDDDDDDGSDIDEDVDMQALLDADAEQDDDDDDEGDESMLDGLTDADLEDLMKKMPKNAGADDFIRAAEALQRQKKGLPPVEDGGEDDFDMNEIGDDEEELAPRPPSKKRKNKKVKEVVVPELAPLSSSKKVKTTSRPASAALDNDYLEPTSLSHGDSLDKSSARKSLRFHVSQVNQKAARREAGHGRRVGGDDDLPRRSKENARREVLKKQTHGGANDGGEALDPSEEWNEEDRKVARGMKGLQEAEGGDADAEDYYEAVKKGREEGRAAKKARYDDERMEERNEIMDLASDPSTGPRGATRKILANKGLTPKRAKVNRNPRVKKRMAYDKAVKKVSTMKSVYKGGDGGNYQGEKSGIGKRTVKSVKLG